MIYLLLVAAAVLFLNHSKLARPAGGSGGTPDNPVPVSDPPVYVPPSQVEVLPVVAYPEAPAPDPEPLNQIGAFDDQLSDKVAFNVNTAEAKQLTIGEAAIASITGGLSAAAAASTSGTILFSATCWTLIGGVIAGAFVLVMKLISDTHLYANALVQTYENPFGSYFISAMDTVDAGWQENGALDSYDVKSIYNAVAIGWGNYRNAMLDLMRRGRDWEIVAKQSLNNLNNEYAGERLPNGKVLGLGMGGVYPDGFVTHWLNWTQGRIEYLESIGR